MTLLRVHAAVLLALGSPVTATAQSAPQAPPMATAEVADDSHAKSTVDGRTAVVKGQQAYNLIPDIPNGQDNIVVEPSDRLSVKVLGEADLSSDQVWVDGAGNIQLLLIGTVAASGKTPDQLRGEISQLLAATYIRDPQVSVTILERAKASITIEGEVRKPGRIEAPPGLTLLGAIAMSESTTKDAKLDNVIVFRVINGRRAAARFNLAAIRKGDAPDPAIIHGDTIIVARSFVKGTYHDFLATLPALSIFYYLK